jgi:hypothetical protein
MTEQQTQDYTARVKDGLDTAKETVTHAAHRATEGLENNPLALVAGGLAVGALAGALIPRSTREKKLLQPVGARLGAAATAAFAAAKEAGRSELETRGLTPDGAKEKAKTFFSEVGKAATGAGQAAVQTAKEEATHASPTGTDQRPNTHNL